MTFYLIGLGLDLKSISVEALDILKKCDKIYLENYTVNFPYRIEDIEDIIGREIAELEREDVENESIVDESKKQDIALLVYGNPLSATTHISLVLRAKKKKIDYKIIHSESVLTAIAETGLQLYKFGKTASMPKFSKGYEPDSFFDIILQNEKIKAHTLLLTDIGLSLSDAINQLKEICDKRNICIDKLVVCSRLGTSNSKIYYDTIDKLIKKDINMPFCIIIPSELHFIEKEALDLLRQKT